MLRYAIDYHSRGAGWLQCGSVGVLAELAAEMRRQDNRLRTACPGAAVFLRARPILETFSDHELEREAREARRLYSLVLAGAAIAAELGSIALELEREHERRRDAWKRTAAIVSAGVNAGRACGKCGGM